MSKRDEWTTEWSDHEDRVGYKRPPKKFQFKKGQSGNLKGRPKRDRNSTKMLREFIHQSITITVGGEIRRMTRLEYLFNVIYAGAVKGNAKASALLMHTINEQGLFEKDFGSNEMRIVLVKPDP
jgi:hypothetical protein